MHKSQHVLYCIVLYSWVIFSPFVDLKDMTIDTQKKSKRKGRNKQEVITLSQTEPEPEVVKTPIDQMRVSSQSAYHLFSYHPVFQGNCLGFSTANTQQMKLVCSWSVCFYFLFCPHHLLSFLFFSYPLVLLLRPKKTVVHLQQRRNINLSISTIKRDKTDWLSCSQVDIPVSALPRSTNLSTIALVVAALFASKRAQAPAFSVEVWYVDDLSHQIPFISSIHHSFC